MEKSTSQNPKLLVAIKERKSGRAYATKRIEKETLELLLEAARWAPSSMNEQPWRYVVADQENRELYTQVLSTLAEPNQTWAKKAPVLLVSLAKKTFIRNGNPNRHALYDTGAANALLSIQASNEGLVVHQMGGFNYQALKTVLGLDDDMDIAAVLSLGYPGELNELPEGYQQRELAPRERYTLSEISK
jgi:nitroreductase